MRYSSSPSVYCHSSFSPVFSIFNVTFNPGHKTAFALSACCNFDAEILGESKYCGSGQNRIVVPVLAFPTLPTSSKSPCFFPPEKLMFISDPFRLTQTSKFFDKAFTTETPTPCKPPEYW